METRVRQRLIGALVLVVAVVLLVPALLRGPAREEATGAAGGPGGSESVVVPIGPVASEERDEPEPEPVAEPAPAVAPPPPAEPAVPDPPASAPRTEPAPVPATAAEGNAPAWAVQLGAFSTRDKADDLVARLRQRGYAAFVLEYRAGGRVLHRVRVGPEQDRSRAAAIAERLRKDGFQTVVAPHP